MVYQALVRPWLFQADPEAAHERVLSFASSTGRCPVARDGFDNTAEAVGTE